MTADPTHTEGSAFGARRRRLGESLWLAILGVAAIISILITVGIVYVLVSEAIPFFGEVSFVEFITNSKWSPLGGEFGVPPLILTSVYVAAIATLVAVPLGVGSAIYLSEYASEPFRKVVKPILELLAGIPTVVLGYFALLSVTPALKDIGVLSQFQTFSILAGGLVVGILITPTISSLSEDALRAVPNSMRDGAYGLGATKREVSVNVVFPAALSGVMASIVLGISRAVGETMIVVLAVGGLAQLTADPREPSKTITAEIVSIAGGEAARGSIQYQSIFAIGLVLFIVTLLINVAAAWIVKRYRVEYR